MKPAASSVFRIRNGIDELGSPWLTALREAEFYINRSKRCAIVYIERARPEIENRGLFEFKSDDLRLAAGLLPIEFAHFLSSAILKIARWL
jgi:hypothetical protein